MCRFLAAGPYTKTIPGRPDLPKGSSERHLLAIPEQPGKGSEIYWFLFDNDTEMKYVLAKCV